MNRISEAWGQVKNVKGQINSLLGKLNRACASVKAEHTAAKSRLQELVEKAAL